MTDLATLERGDVVYGDDPFNGAGTARPWLVVADHEGRPFHGEQYVALTLTTKSWMEGLVNRLGVKPRGTRLAFSEEIPPDAWLCGGTPDESRIVPWGVQSIDHEDVDF